MDLSSLIQIVSALAMTPGIAFGILNLRNFQATRRREAAVPAYIARKNWKPK